MTQENINKIKNTPLYFVIGKERSGTTMLQAILNAHPNIVAPSESRIIIYMYSKYGKIKIWTEKRLREFCDELYTETRFEKFWRINRDELLSTLVTVREELTYGLILKIIYCMFSPGKDIKIIFDKNPPYYFFLTDLREIFPEARFIHIIRDYRDNIISHRKALPLKNVADLAYRWVAVNEYIEKAKKASPGNWYTVKYEDLVDEPVKYVKEVCAFIQLPFDESMVNDFNSKLSHVFMSNQDNKKFMNFHSNVYKPINTDAVGKWKKELSIQELQTIESIAGPYGEQQYGYKMAMPYKKPRLFVMMRARLVLMIFSQAFVTMQKHHFIYKILKVFIRITPKKRTSKS